MNPIDRLRQTMLGNDPLAFTRAEIDRRSVGHDLQIGDGEIIYPTLRDFAERLQRELTGPELEATWLVACGKEALRVWPEFQKTHPYAAQEPDGTQSIPGPGVAYPSLVAAYLEDLTGLGDWRVKLVRETEAGTPRWKFTVTPPPIPRAGR